MRTRPNIPIVQFSYKLTCHRFFPPRGLIPNLRGRDSYRAIPKSAWGMIQSGKQVRHAWDAASVRFRRCEGSGCGSTFEGRRTSATAFGAGRDLRRLPPHAGGPSGWRDPANDSRLGCQVQRFGAVRADRQEAARPAAASERRASCRSCDGRRKRSEPCGRRRRALADRRSQAMALRPISSLSLRTDAKPRAARDELSSAVRTSASSRPSRWRG